MNALILMFALSSSPKNVDLANCLELARVEKKYCHYRHTREKLSFDERSKRFKRCEDEWQERVRICREVYR